MASSGTKGVDEESRSSPAASQRDDIERGWTDPPAQATEAPTETKAEPAEPAAPAPAEAKPPPKAPRPTEAPRPPEAAQPREAQPVADDPPADAPPAAEASPEALQASQPSPSVQAPPAVETLPPEALWQVAPPPAKPPPLPVTAPSAFEATEPLRKPGPLALLLEAPPTRGWFFVGGVGMIVALFAGIAIGRGLPRTAERVAAAPVPPPRTAAPSVAPAPAPSAPKTASAPTVSAKPSGGASKYVRGPFNAQAAKVAIDRIVPRLKGCKQPGEPPGTATVTVTFAPTGRVSNAAVTTQRYAGTRTGTCIAARLREARVAEFTGKPVTVKRGIAVK